VERVFTFHQPAPYNTEAAGRGKLQMALGLARNELRAAGERARRLPAPGA
jgi:hypothetical protein